MLGIKSAPMPLLTTQYSFSPLRNLKRASTWIAVDISSDGRRCLWGVETALSAKQNPGLVIGDGPCVVCLQRMSDAAKAAVLEMQLVEREVAAVRTRSKSSKNIRDSTKDRTKVM